MTILRIILVPFIVFFLFLDCFKYRYLISFFIFLLASFTDYLDGKLAREKGLITSFGQIMDPMADKILVSAIFISFAGSGKISTLAVIIIILREFIITSVRFLVFQSSNQVISANIFGKLKTVSQMVAIIGIFLVSVCSEVSTVAGNYITENIGFFLILQDSLIWISAVFSVLSGGVYIYLNRNSIISSF